jgi:hypothetical protein
MALRKALLFSYAENKNYPIEIEESTDLDDDNFDWETELLHAIEEGGETPNTSNGVSWAWA